MKNHYDIGVYGWWGHENFGGCLTYFALERVLKKLGRTVLMVQEANGIAPRYNIPDNSIAMSFAKKRYDCSPQVNVKDLYKFNDICDSFIVGGDQMWNNYITFVKEDNFLNFVDNDKLKISYSTSFGTTAHNPSKEYLDNMAPLLKRFDAVSVREDYGVDSAKLYGVNATQVIDAVFLLDKSEYIETAKDADVCLPKKYLLSFILNPSKEKREQIEIIANKLNLEIVCVPDAAGAYHRDFNEIFSGLNILSPLSISNFIKAYENASYVITDSFHGTCFSYIFKKDFSVYFNTTRGADRFVSLMKILKQDARRITEDLTEEQIRADKNIDFNVDWKESDVNVSRERKRSLNWLKTSLSIKKPSTKTVNVYNKFKDLENGDGNPEALALYRNPDFIRIQLLATLLRDYGIKHIVLSPGGRDVPLIRMFEYNEGTFTIHRVTDERSAAYYGLGIAAQLKQPVACVCTSGTAASNFLPAVTEAYYTGVPLIVITADRYEVYHNQGEDQTIPQKHIYNGVIKKEVSLPEGAGYAVEYQSRRDIEDCILESTHNGFGPVHINIPIDNISIGASLPRENWKLLPFIYPHILRVGFNDGQTEMFRWVDSLKQSPRILIVYGQNSKLSEKQLRNVEDFASKYNCVIATDFISNLDCKYSVKPYNMLNSISQEVFNRELSPDIVISVGGKSLMNDPLTFKIRGGLKNIRHWSVTSDGKIKDFYFRLSSVIESTQDNFFEWFSKNAGDSRNNGEYYEKWKNMIAQHSQPKISDFNAHYVQSRFFPSVPANSLLHLGVGQSFFDCRRYNLDASIEVFCNMGTNGIDGCTSTFMGQCSVVKDRLCFLLVGDLSFFYDMNSIWNKQLNKNIRILMVNNNGTGLLRSHNLKGVSSVHNTAAEGWVKSTGFDYICAHSMEEYDEKLRYFLSSDSPKALFFEVFCN